MKVLLIEPDPARQQMLVEATAGRGHHLTTAPDGDAASTAQQQKHHPLVLIDAASLGKETAEICRRLRAVSGRLDCRILVLGARSEPDHLRSLLAAGADDCLAGPLDAELLKVRLTVAEEAVRASQLAASREVQLRTSEQRYRLIAENATDMIWTARLEGIDQLPERLKQAPVAEVAGQLMHGWQFTYVSPSVERMLGYQVDEATALALEQLLTPPSYQQAVGVLAEELATEAQGSADPDRQRVLELQHRAKAGSLRWCEVTTKFLRDEAGRVAGVLGVTRDIDQRRKAEDALRESESKLRGLVANMPDEVIIGNYDGIIQYGSSQKKCHIDVDLT